MTMLEVEELRVVHRGAPLVAVRGLRLAAGRPLTVVGESGSGKSLLAHGVVGTLPRELAATGTMVLDGTPHDLAVTGGRRRLWGRGIALLPQEPALALDPTMRVRGQVAEGVPGFASRRREAVLRAEEALADVGLAPAAAAYPHTLSGGMAQRVAYTAATVGGSSLLVVDEPTKGLDRDAVDRLAALLRRHVDEGGLLLTITHDLRLAAALGGDVAVMREAEVVEHGPASEVLTAPSTDYARRLLAADPAGWARSGSSSGSGSALVTADRIAKGYDGHALFDDLSLEVRAGERWALTGPSGAGKTTLGDALLRLLPVDAGRVTHAPELAGGRAQKLYQDPALSFPARVPLGTAVGDAVRRHGVAATRVEQLLARLGLPTSLLERRPGQVSGGELQRLAILRALLPRPRLVLADEATSRLDLLTQQATVECLLPELEETGCALLLVTHDPALAAALTDRGLRLGGGRRGAGGRSVSVAAARGCGRRRGDPPSTPRAASSRRRTASAPTSRAR